jgi:phosphatidylglycerophosphate synthase
MGGLLLAATAVWDCCDGDVARLKFMESDFGEKLDTVCDNIINVFIFVGLMFGTAHSQGLAQAMIPFLMLALGGSSIFYLIYFPKGGKGSFFKNTPIYDVIQILASRNFIYIIFIFAVVDKLGWFLWLAGIGSNVFALSMYMVKRKILVSLVRETSE